MDETIRGHMEVLGADGGHVGTVDALDTGGRIRLTAEDDPARNHGHRHLPLRLVAGVEAGRVRLTVPAAEARAIAMGAISPDDADAGAGPVGAGEAAVGDMVGQSGGGSGMVQGGGTTGRGGAGLGDGPRLTGGGTGGGGTTRHGHLGSGGGIAGDPNMDPSGRGSV